MGQSSWIPKTVPHCYGATTEMKGMVCCFQTFAVQYIKDYVLRSAVLQESRVPKNWHIFLVAIFFLVAMFLVDSQGDREL